MLEFIFLAILGLRPTWQPGACDHAFATETNRAICERDRDEGAAWARDLAGYIVTEAARQDMDPLLLVAVAYIESRFEAGDVCRKVVDGDRIVSREAIGDDGRERLVVRHRSDPEQTSEVTVTVLEERENGDLYVDKCSAGEMGLMQLCSHEARAGTVVPATGEELPRDPRARRARVLDPIVNVSLGAVALAGSRSSVCEDEEGEDAMLECRIGWMRWVAHYNTGKTSGEKFDHYTRLISAAYRKAQEYACAEMPDNELCLPSEAPDADEAEVEPTEEGSPPPSPPTSTP